MKDIKELYAIHAGSITSLCTYRTSAFSIADVILFTIENKTYFNQLAQPFYEAESQATYADN